MDRGEGCKGRNPGILSGNKRERGKKKERKGNVGNFKRSKFDRSAVRIQVRAQFRCKLRA